MSVTEDPAGVATLRSYDAYSHAERFGLGVGFEPLPGGIPSVLLRSQGVVMINSHLPEPVRHDELAHQLAHLLHPPRCGESREALEDAVQLEAARRLIPIPALRHALRAVVAVDAAEANVLAAAKLLGTQPITLRDRLFSLTPDELVCDMGDLAALTWPRVIRPPRWCCDPDAAPPRPWWGRMRGLLPPYAPR